MTFESQKQQAELLASRAKQEQRGVFRLTDKQRAAQELLAGPQLNTMLFGGSRSGKTFLWCRTIAFRSLAAPGSRHAILRHRGNAAKASVALDTFPKMMRLCFPHARCDWKDALGYFDIGQGSEVWIGGLDDEKRLDKILGREYATILLNECSQIPWGTVGVVRTRLAQVIDIDVEGEERRPLKRILGYDCNPPPKNHWTYKVFVQHRNPETGEAMPDQADYRAMRINPEDNRENTGDYVERVLGGLSSRLKKRFLLGEFADANPSALFPEEHIDQHRIEPDELGQQLQLPDFVRVVVGVDPSGSGDEDNADNDEIGIVVGALGTDGRAYLLEDCSVKAGPATWGSVATSAFERHQADKVVGEQNYGGAMVGHVITTARPRTPFKLVTATRGKAVRAEPFSALYEQGKVRHVGRFNELEDELAAFATFGYTGSGSPNRADAWIWVLAELFPGLTRPGKLAPAKAAPPALPIPGGWLA